MNIMNRKEKRQLVRKFKQKMSRGRRKVKGASGSNSVFMKKRKK